jgi:hypothetical protein
VAALAGVAFTDKNLARIDAILTGGV